MRAPVYASAPGKAILHGEHSVVHGRTALAVSVNLRSYVSVVPLERSGVALRFPDVDVDAFWSAAEINECAKACHFFGTSLLGPS